ncbi:hypothetical protein J2Z21_005737 [Streptomyces griseochromogenes]|uniref:Uncharacterized protein n=1 Tax=Streptomyces griseochromogenes TaxID=68214 RepID=A0A1B1B9Y7_9ACTN|nr:hypothetical protein [Streptomyces griseochromogenes]ANP55633.1 hypothetical protein AVL59_43925 [Streptomyces griseochromogenes]MBP2052750.1 hypothetical protein [Streptomyces griseochromogenes]
MTGASPPPMPPCNPTPPAKKSRTNLIITASAAAVIAAVIGTGMVVMHSSYGSKPAAAARPKGGATETPTPTPLYGEVTADSFTIELRTTKRQCFGTAGCNVTVEPDFTYLGDSEGIDPDAVYEITYEIHGDESGPVIETAELSDRTSLNYTPSVISTASAGTNVSAEITDVTAQGG